MTAKTKEDQPVPEGLRERKQRETRRRIAETGLKLFLANGYDATTLDAIAEAADISRRTFFSYFKSKEEIMLVWQAGAWCALIRLAVNSAAVRAHRYRSACRD